jgi:hypothetical protein
VLRAPRANGRWKSDWNLELECIVYQSIKCIRANRKKILWKCLRWGRFRWPETRSCRYWAGGRPEMRIWRRRGQRCGGGWHILHILLVVMKRCALSGGGWDHDRRIRRSRIFGKLIPVVSQEKILKYPFERTVGFDWYSLFNLWSTGYCKNAHNVNLLFPSRHYWICPTK